MKDCNGHRVYSPEEAKEVRKLASYFERLYTPTQIDEEIISYEIYINQKKTEHALNKKVYDWPKINEPFTIKEVKDAMKVLKRKARGPDDIPNEFMIEGGIVIQTILLKEWSKAELV